jgi:hypothetical protein
VLLPPSVLPVDGPLRSFLRFQGSSSLASPSLYSPKQWRLIQASASPTPGTPLQILLSSRSARFPNTPNSNSSSNTPVLSSHTLSSHNSSSRRPAITTLNQSTATTTLREILLPLTSLADSKILMVYSPLSFVSLSAANLSSQDVRARRKGIMPGLSTRA